MNLAKTIDHTILKPGAEQKDVERICAEAKKWNFASVCINPCWVSLAFELLKDTDVKVCTVIGFPLGAATTASKAFEAEEAIENGAGEVDMVINVGRLTAGDYVYVREDIRAVVEKAGGRAVTKVILETCLLTRDQIVKACELAVEAGADYVKTSTGFSTGGATVEAVSLMYETVKGKAKVKASGGIRTYEDAMKMIQAGASRIGTSKGVNIVSGQ